MNPKKSKLLAIFLLLLPLCVVLLGGCKKGEGESIQIDSLTLDEKTDIQLNSIISKNNNCLLNFQKDIVSHVIFNQSELNKLDNCNSIPEIDFSKYTLIVGKIMVSSISDNISAITLTSNETKATYNLEVSISEPDGCYAAIGHLYFWRIYPKLNAKYDFRLLVTGN